MTKILFSLFVGLICCTFSSQAQTYSDIHKHSYKVYDNLYNDLDKDGVSGYFDYNDRNPYKQYSSYPSYTPPAPSYTPNDFKTIYTGPRGGQYYYNNSGNKVYVK